jgi:hypothetical protein
MTTPNQLSPGDNAPSIDDIDFDALATRLFDNDLRSQFPSGGAPGGAPADPSPADPAKPPAAPITFEGREIFPDELRGMLRWNDHLASNQDLLPEIGRVLARRPSAGLAAPAAPAAAAAPTPPDPAASALPAPPAPPTPPDWVDPDDPRTVSMWAELQRRDLELAALKEQVAQTHQTAQQAAGAEDNRIAADAVEAFRAAHNLDGPTMSLVIAESVRFVDSVWNPQNKRASFDRALEVAYLANPQFQPPPAPPLVPTPLNTNDEQRRRSLDALTGGSGSAPRSAPVPRLDSDQDMKDAIAKVIEEKHFS